VLDGPKPVPLLGDGVQSSLIRIALGLGNRACNAGIKKRRGLINMIAMPSMKKKLSCNRRWELGQINGRWQHWSTHCFLQANNLCRDGESRTRRVLVPITIIKDMINRNVINNIIRKLSLRLRGD